MPVLKSPNLFFAPRFITFDSELSPTQIIYRTPRRDLRVSLLVIGLLALAVRLLYLRTALDYLGLEQLWNFARDTNTYWAVGQHFLGGSYLGDYCLFRVGPGYGLMLAGLQVLFGPSPMAAILLNILLGSLAPVLVFLLARELFESKPVAWIAGLISALSHTAIALSCQILTDQPFFTFHVAALLCFVLGLKGRSTGWFVVAGCLAGVATLIRPSGQLWPMLFLAMAVLVPWLTLSEGRSPMIRKALLTGAIMLVVVLGWSARNYAAYGEFTFGSNGVYTLQGCPVAQVMSDHYGRSVGEYRKEFGPDYGINPGQFMPSYRAAKARVAEMVGSHPIWLIRVALANMESNIEAMDPYTYGQIPALRQPMEILDRQMRLWGGATLAILLLVALAVLIVRRHHPAWVVLGFTYLYFTLMCGFSIWQGSRLHYPAEMAWSILIAWLSVQIYNTLFRRSRLRSAI
ncbi:hypothetical protein C3F09_03770 [candidate division GN15 bacterium]|uniref:Glycosyltransferase RgtA/B/C/D-like domain-containing protein n=1 Tax=candidate division GN15 bacterium TaxID=2072418 RepID=A0A855X2V0_9BACT|nr:MAG: hypothetical protein C3F09_03770 [candidate division GN15 bacterium]